MSKKQNKPDGTPPATIQRIPIFDLQFRKNLAGWFKVDRGPFTGMGEPEPVKYLNADTWSRQIDFEKSAAP